MPALQIRIPQAIHRPLWRRPRGHELQFPCLLAVAIRGHEQPGMHSSNDIVDSYNNALRNSAKKAAIIFVDVEPKFKTHRICDHVHDLVSVPVQGEARDTPLDCLEEKYDKIWSKVPPSNSWIQEYRGEDLFYPNQRSHVIYAEALAEAVFGVKFRHWEDNNYENDTPGDNPEIDNVEIPLEWDCPLGRS